MSQLSHANASQCVKIPFLQQRLEIPLERWTNLQEQVTSTPQISDLQYPYAS